MGRAGWILRKVLDGLGGVSVGDDVDSSEGVLVL